MKLKLSSFRNIIKEIAKSKIINDYTNAQVDDILEKATNVIKPYSKKISKKKGIKASIEGAVATGVAVAVMNGVRPFIPVDEPETANAIGILIGVIIGALFNGAQKFLLNWKNNKDS